eukprot:1197934-Amphidinium_carterae.1
MLSVPKQQSHKRNLPAVLEGNKPNEQQGPMTTFKNWAAEVHICMSLEDHNLSNMLEDVKTQKVAIVDANYIDYHLHQQGLGQKNEDELREKKLQKLLRVYNTRTEPILRRDAKKAKRRESGEDGVPADEAVPAYPELPDTFDPFTDEQLVKINEFMEAFNHYSRALQHTLTKVTKGEPYRF